MNSKSSRSGDIILRSYNNVYYFNNKYISLGLCAIRISENFYNLIIIPTQTFINPILVILIDMHSNSLWCISYCTYL